MTTRQNTVRSILLKLTGNEPDEAHVAQMANIAEAVDIHPDDALFPLMVALDYYRVAYQEIPAGIKEASAFILREHAAAFRAEAQSIEAKHRARLAEGAAQLADAVKQWMDKVLPEQMRAHLQNTACAALGAPVDAAVRRLARATHEINNATFELYEARRRNTLTCLCNMLAATLLTGMGSAAITAWMLQEKPAPAPTADQQTMLRWGAAVQASWPKLPAEAQGMLRAAADAGTGQKTALKQIKQSKKIKEQVRLKKPAERQEQAGDVVPAGPDSTP